LSFSGFLKKILYQEINLPHFFFFFKTENFEQGKETLKKVFHLQDTTAFRFLLKQ
jgi:hypothetical protein